MNIKLFARYAIREMMGLLVMGVALFWSAGRVDWWPGWAVLAVMLVWMVITAFVITRIHPGLLAERLGPRRGAKRWDVAIMSALGFTQLSKYIIAGLDQRYGWSGGFSFVAQAAALIACAAGYALFVWAMASNPFFSQIVRIQTERNQAVMAGGPYRFVRHPGYAGAIVFELASPILLGSWRAFIVGVMSALLLMLRTALEDRTLLAELPGYADYARRVRFRLAAHVW